MIDPAIVERLASAWRHKKKKFATLMRAHLAAAELAGVETSASRAARVVLGDTDAR